MAKNNQKSQKKTATNGNAKSKSTSNAENNAE